jgi:hypothetical protein
MELSIVIKVIGDLVPTIDPIRACLNELRADWQNASIVFGRLQVVHLKFFQGNDDTFQPFTGWDEGSIMKLFLTSEIPSLFTHGVRQVDAALLSMRPASAANVMRNVYDPLINGLFRFHRINSITSLGFAQVSRFFENPAFVAFHVAICDCLRPSLAVQPGSAAFVPSLRWIPSAIKGCGLQAVQKDPISFTKVFSPVIFQLAIAILQERLQKCSKQQADSMMMNAFSTFLSSYSQIQSYFTSHYLKWFIYVAQKHNREILLHIFLNSFKSLSFLPVFLCLADARRRIPDQGWFSGLVDSVLPAVPEASREAVVLLQKGAPAAEAVRVARLHQSDGL